jgi:hypothetical protein
VNLRNEVAAMQLLLEIVNGALSNYPTSLSQDVADLLDEHAYPRFSNKRHAKIQVRGEKEVLHHYQQWAKSALYVMKVMKAEFEGKDAGTSFEQVISKMDEGEELHHTIVRHCADVLGSLRREELKELRRKAAGY